MNLSFNGRLGTDDSGCTLNQFFYVHASGLVLEKSSFTAALEGRHTGYTLERVSARRYGHVLLASGSYAATSDPSDPDEGDISPEMHAKYVAGARLTFSASWTLRAGTYECLHMHSTYRGRIAE